MSLTQRIRAVDSVGVSGERRLKDGSQLMSDHLVDISNGDVFDMEQLTANPVRRVILVHQEAIRQLVQVTQCQYRVVVLHNHLKDTKRLLF